MARALRKISTPAKRRDSDDLVAVQRGEACACCSRHRDAPSLAVREHAPQLHVPNLGHQVAARGFRRRGAQLPKAPEEASRSSLVESLNAGEPRPQSLPPPPLVLLLLDKAPDVDMGSLQRQAVLEQACSGEAEGRPLEVTRAQLHAVVQAQERSIEVARAKLHAALQAGSPQAAQADEQACMQVWQSLSHAAQPDERPAEAARTHSCAVQADERPEVSRRHSHAAEADERPAVARRHSYAVQADERAQVSGRHSHAAEADERPAEARRHSYADQADERAQVEHRHSCAAFLAEERPAQVSRRHSHAAEADERPAEVARRHSYAVQADERAQQLKQTSVLQRCGLRRMRTRSERTRRCRLHGHHHPALAHQVSCSRRGMICPSSREMILAGLKLPAVNMKVEVLPCRKCPGWCEPSVESQEGPIEMPRREALAWNEASPSQTSLSSESLPKGDVAVRAREVRTRPCLARVPDYVNLVSITSKMRKQALNVHQQAAASSPRGSMKRAPFRAAMRLTRPPQRFRAGPET
ncbi:unnamed protein product [Effrenium voratum]|nr:unnamed protein product [Effrenium voratum]